MVRLGGGGTGEVGEKGRSEGVRKEARILEGDRERETDEERGNGKGLGQLRIRRL